MALLLDKDVEVGGPDSHVCCSRDAIKPYEFVRGIHEDGSLLDLFDVCVFHIFSLVED
jgi:hypothetical protein